ncbi:MAG: hypothetical protein ACRD4E_09130 [Bryobacteraceae bacterium]
MRIRIVALGFLCAACLCGQSKRFSWQDLCFKNPAAPVCQGNDYAVKPQPKATPTPSVVTNPFPSQGVKASPANRSSGSPTVIAVGGVDWRFADPFADAVIGLNFSGFSNSPLIRSVITMLGAKQGLTDAEIQKIFEGVSDVDQVALSVRNTSGNTRIVAMITGHVADSALPAPEAGMKAVPVSGGSMLIGHADAVDQAMQRIARKDPATELTRSYEARQGDSEFWAVGSARLAGPQAASSGVKQFALTVWIRNRLTTDLTLELNGVPNANALQTWQAQLGSAATVEGNAIHVRASIEADEVQQKFGQIAASPLGQGLAALVEAARYLPVRDRTVPQQTKPIIYGLDSR